MSAHPRRPNRSTPEAVAAEPIFLNAIRATSQFECSPEATGLVHFYAMGHRYLYLQSDRISFHL